MRWGPLGTALVVCATRAGATCDWPANELLRISGEVTQGGLRGSFERSVDPASGRFVETLDLGVLRTGTGFDGRLAWSKDDSGVSHYLNSDFARRLAVSEAWLTAHLCSENPALSAGASHVGIDPQSHLDVWHFVPNGGAPIELWYDDKTGRLDRAILQYSENRIIHHFAEWHEVAPGRFLPFAQRDEDPEDESDQTYKIDNVSTKEGMVSFGPPLPPDDAKIAGGESTVVPFEDDQRHRVFVPVYLNGKGPFTFEIDNGGHFILTEETAAALGLKAHGSFASTGAGTEIQQAGYVPIEKLGIGNAEVTHQTAKVLSMSHNERPGRPPRAGILGLEFFERFIVSIDHRKKTVTLRLLSHPETYAGQSLPITFDEDAPLTEGGFDGVAGNVMLDIGNAGPTIVEHYWAASHGLVPALSNGTPRGDAKLSKGTVRIGPFDLSDESAVYYGPAERGSEDTRSVAAMAGEPLLSRFNATYDYHLGKVWLEPLPEMPPVAFDKR